MTIVFNRVATNTQQLESITAISAQREAIARTQRELSTGKKEFTDSASVLSVRALERFISEGERYALSANVLEYRLNLAELSLSSGIDILQRARELAVFANNASVSVEARQVAANEIDTLFEDVLRIANSKDAFGDHIFGGSQTSQPPFVQNGEAVSYQGDSDSRSVRVSDLRLIRDGFPGDQVFMDIPAGDGAATTQSESVFATLTRFRDALRSPLDTNEENARVSTELSAVLQQLDAALGSLSDARSVTGSRMLALQDVNEFRTAQLDLSRESLAKISDVDFAEAIARLNQQITALEVAQQSYAKVNTATLFDYL